MKPREIEFTGTINHGEFFRAIAERNQIQIQTIEGEILFDTYHSIKLIDEIRSPGSVIGEMIEIEIVNDDGRVQFGMINLIY